MNYCNECKALCGEQHCKYCGSEKLREVMENDYCLLITCEQSLGETICFSLEENGIESARVPFGDGARTALGLSLGNFAIYVPYRYYEQAREIVEFFTIDPTPQLKQDLLDNYGKWHVASEKAQKKMRKKLRLNDEQELFSYIRGEVEASLSIMDKGPITSCIEQGHYILVRVSNKVKIIWFNSKTFEVFL